MLVFDVFVNGEPKCRAGVASGILTAIVTYASGGEHRGKTRQEVLEVHVMGLAHPKDEHLNWLVEPLRRGDRVTVEITEADGADEARVRQRPPRPAPRGGSNLQSMRTLRSVKR
jgi:hypothetical protein